MMKPTLFRSALLAAATFLLSVGAGAVYAGDLAGSGLAQLRQLEGRWEGVNSKGAKANVSFEVTADGSVVLERLKMADHPEMLTLYYRDGEQLMLTHFCMSGNQPRMKAKRISADEIQFEFVDATNLASLDDGHMHRAVLSFSDSGQYSAAWTWNEGGRDAFTEVIQLSRLH